jgi:hypothetical protein
MQEARWTNALLSVYSIYGVVRFIVSKPPLKRVLPASCVVTQHIGKRRCKNERFGWISQKGIQIQCAVISGLYSTNEQNNFFLAQLPPFE